MLNSLIEKKTKGYALSLADYYSIVDYMMKNNIDKTVKKMFISLDSFGMTNKETLYLALALRDSGKVLKFNQLVFEKHSSGGVGDSTSMVLVPLLASLGYKVIKTTAKSFVFTNGSADRFGAIPNFSTQLEDDDIKRCLNSTNACILSHNGDMCPADRILFDLREKYDLSANPNFLAASIAAKKLASGASVVLVDIKYGLASVLRTYKEAVHTAKLLRYIFSQEGVESVVTITNTAQTIGDGIGNAVEVVDALRVLQGRKCLLRDVVVRFATEMIVKSETQMSRKDIVNLIENALDKGYAYNRFLEIVKAQGGDVKAVEESKIFKPYRSINFVSDKNGYVGYINSLLLGEMVRTMCQDSHDNNIGIVLKVKIGDYVKKGDIVVTLFYKDEASAENYKRYIMNCIKMTQEEVSPVSVIEKIFR